MEPWPFSHGYGHRIPDRLHDVRPSMEPWPFSHGYAGLPNLYRQLSTPFNGAMALQPWIRGYPLTVRG